MFKIIHKAQYLLTFPYIQYSIPFNISTIDMQLSPITIDIPKVQPSLAFHTSTLLGILPSKEDQDTLKHIHLESSISIGMHSLHTLTMHLISCISSHSSHSIHHA
jgi:hypothetical protein